MTWINEVYCHGISRFVPRQGMWLKDLETVKKEWYSDAVKLLKETGADHVVYCTVEYDEDDTPVEVNLYLQPLSDDDFYERTDTVAQDAGKKNRTMYIGAVHKRK